MDNITCARCGNENPDEEEIYCPECEGLLRSSRKKRLWYSTAGIVVFIIVAVGLWYVNTGSWDFSWNALTGKPAAVINGELVARSDLNGRLKVSMIMLERQYGKDIFAGERGRALLTELEEEVLGRILEERLVAQEARRMGIEVSDDRVRQELERIGSEIYGNAEKFQVSLREDGISPEYLMGHIRYQFLCREIKKLKFASQADSDTSFGAWLAQARKNAKITVNKTISPLQQVSSQGRGSCCGSGGGGGCGGRGGGGCGTKQAGPLDPKLESKASAAALAEYWKKSPAEKGVEAKVTDYGCHIQVDIVKGSKTVKSYAYQDGSVIDN